MSWENLLVISALVLFVSFYADLEVSITRDPDGTRRFRFSIGIKKS